MSGDSPSSRRLAGPESEARNTAGAFEQIRDHALFRMDMNGFALTWNEGVQHVLGYERDEWIGHDTKKLMWLEDDVANRAAERELAAAARDGHAGNDRWLKKKGGQAFWAMGGTTAVYNDAGEVVGFSKVLRDLTELKVAQDSVHQSEQRYRELFNAIDEGFCVIEVEFDDGGAAVDYRFVEVNAAFERQTGLKDAAGRRMREMVPEHNEVWFRAYGEIARGGPARRFEDYAPAMGRWFDVYAFPFERGGGPGGDHRVGLVFRDISERKRMDAALRAVNDDLRDLADLIAHDLKEPLRGILFSAQVMEEDCPLPEVAKQRLGSIREMVRRQQALIDGLLEYSRAGRVELRLQRVSLTDLAREAARQVERGGGTVQIQPGMPEVDGDPLLLRQVLANLIGNGLKYNKSESPTVEVNAGVDERGVIVRVRDNGIGIPAAQLERAFRLFKRLHPRDAFGGGTGVGLPMARRLVERHEGRMWAESEVGVGTTFFVCLPVGVGRRGCVEGVKAA